MQVCVALRGLVILGIPGCMSSSVEGKEIGTGAGLRRRMLLLLPRTRYVFWLRVNKVELVGVAAGSRGCKIESVLA